MFKILFAPLQGYTTGIYRKAHRELAGGADAYYAPFLRIENGKVRDKDMRDLDENSIPQIIANSVDEFKTLACALAGRGFKEIDFNMGCPFPMQVNRHRGAGLLSDLPTVKAIMDEIARHDSKPECERTRFSIKMRLGLESSAEAFALLPILNETPLTHITLHPRLGKQQYKGAVDFDAFRKFAADCRHPLYYNGDIDSLKRIFEIETKFPELTGVMIGRGLLANPALATEYKSGRIWSENERRTLVLKMHAALMDFACRTYQGDSQILAHLKCFWDYPGENLPKKIFKKISKAGKLGEYREAVALLRQNTEAPHE